jgi:hypothetical protein
MQALRDAQNAERELVAAQRWKEIDEGNARALRENNLRPTWTKKSEDK